MGSVPVYCTTTSAQFQIGVISPIRGFVTDFINRSLSEFEYDTRLHRYNFICSYADWKQEAESITIPINFLPVLEDYLANFDYKDIFNRHEVPCVEPRSIDIKPDKNWNPREKQAEYIDFLVNDPRPRKGIKLQTGKGKMQPLDAKIRTPHGWCTMEDICCGSEILGPDGNVCKVTATYPHANKEIYLVYFKDGRVTECGLDHLWEVHVKTPDSTPQILDTRTIYSMLCFSNESLFISLAEPYDSKEIDFPIDPNIVGTMLITDEDDFTVDLIKQFEDGSIQQRYSLLQGLLDISGSILKDDSVYVLVRKQRTALCLANLVYSLGGKATVMCRSNGFSIMIRVKDQRKLFSLKRKQDQFIDPLRFKNQKLQIDVVMYSRTCDAKCITTDDPRHCYVTDNYIVTHNTFIAIRSAITIGYATMIITGMNIGQWVKAISDQTSISEHFKYIDSKAYKDNYKWVRDINDQCKASGSQVYIICGAESIRRLVADDVYPSIFVCSTATLRDFANGEPSYNNIPFDFHGFQKKYGIGTKIVDEAHQNFHAINRMDLKSNIKNNFYLTATFIKNGVQASRIFNTVYPYDMQYGESLVSKHTDTYVYAYRGNVPPNFVKRKRGYSHVRYEQYILKRSLVLKDYLETTVLPEVYSHYVVKRNPGEKALLFFSTVKMINAASDYLTNELSKYNITVKPKIAGVPDDVLTDPEFDIYIGTPRGLGTGCDIPKLRSAMNFVSIDSEGLVKQMFGRLRELPNITTEFVDNVDRMIDSQVRHFKTRDRIYKQISKNYRCIKLS